MSRLKENPKRYVHFSLFGRSEAREKERAEERAARAEAKRLKDSLKRVR